jgi:hypothetical protein
MFVQPPFRQKGFFDQLIRREQRLLNSRRLYARKKPAEREGSMTKRSLMFALGATLLLSGSTAAVSATPHTLSRYCAVDLKSLCAGIKPGEGRIHACLQSHISELSVGCSARLSRAAWVAKECHADIQHFCPHAVYGSIASCMKPHLGEVSDPCKGALAFVASPANDR